MTEYLPAIAAVIAGIFAILSPFITWKLKNASDEKARLKTLEKEHHDSIERLYTGIFVLFEQAIRQVLQNEDLSLEREFSEHNAKVHLLASKQVASQYSEVVSLLENWSQLHSKAVPRQIKSAEQTITIIQAPDPTAKYKEPANTAYDKLQNELQRLIEFMRGDLNGKSAVSKP